MAVGDFISGGLGLGNMLFGAGERARQQTAEHNAAMVDADKMRMSPWLSAAAQAPTQRTKVESPGGALMGGATSLWAQLQAGQAAEEAKAERLAAQKLNERSVYAQEMAARNATQPIMGVSALSQTNHYSPYRRG